ncbi:hypothetical protein BDZ89DRAFT_1134704 [Hymenopellis radicata]|nr:hypothetical protein BDZ89DRAFT_1134704 [Hymenopellis radicata]
MTTTRETIHMAVVHSRRFCSEFDDLLVLSCVTGHLLQACRMREILLSATLVQVPMESPPQTARLGSWYFPLYGRLLHVTELHSACRLEYPMFRWVCIVATEMFPTRKQQTYNDDHTGTDDDDRMFAGQVEPHKHLNKVGTTLKEVRDEDQN